MLPGAPYIYSYSGADARPFVWFDGLEQEIVELESVHTVSVSVHEAKGQARALGFRGIKGLARGVRTIAGSMIFTVVKDHPLRPLTSILSKTLLDEENQPRETDLSARASRLQYGRPFQDVGWSVDRNITGTGTYLDQFAFNNRLATLMPPFNMMLQYVAEEGVDARAADRTDDIRWLGQYGQLEAGPITLRNPVRHAHLAIHGIEFIDEGIVTSINDIVSEVTMNFLAYDFKPIFFNGGNVGIVKNYVVPKAIKDKERILARTEQGKAYSLGMGSGSGDGWGTE